MDVIWLKRDVRLQDHGPFSAVAMSNNPVLILYLYEPDQLSESSVHGSHVLFVHEGLIDLENHIAEDHSRSCFECVNICHNTAIGTFEHLRTNHNINRIFCHQETGHWQSFMRDKGIRKWCRSHSIPIIEFNQTGVTRCLKDRDEYHQKFKSFINRHCHKTPDVAKLRKRLIVLRDLPGYITTKKIDLNIFCEIPNEHRVDRPQRQQQGGIRQALATLESFLETRGSKFSQGISSPNTSWTSCSRLSPYLTWGHISLRHVIQSLQEKQKLLRQMKASGKDTGTWLKSLQAFSSRLHWRSHFIQKLESEPTMEKRDLCIAYQPLRRQEGDWKHQHYIAWIKGKTGFPFVDACMRCLVQHGWINFRMRAMLVSFATYNLWLDWKRLAPHLARVFLDYEPGIHYPQLQMQAGTTGINAMRVYNVTKQGKDQDPQGIFIKRYIPELKDIPLKYVHEPWKMPVELQNDIQVVIGSRYPAPIVQEQESAKLAKQKVAAVRNKFETKTMAKQVYMKHGSRNARREEINGTKPKALSSAVLREYPSKQPLISSMFAAASSLIPPVPVAACQEMNWLSDKDKASKATNPNAVIQSAPFSSANKRHPRISTNIKRRDVKRIKVIVGDSTWSCKICTFVNNNPLGLACSMCGTPKYH